MKRRVVTAPVARVRLVALAVVFGGAEPSRGDGCAAVCEDPARVVACNDGRPVWGFREARDVCRGGSFGYLESRENADAERLRLAKSHKRRCDAGAECQRFRALDEAGLVCLACGPDARLSALSAASEASPGGKAPPCSEDEWLRAGTSREPARCFVEFAALPPRLALQGRCSKGDCRSGSGTVRWPTGESYAGRFRNGKRDGQGTFSWPDGRMYIGEWRSGQPGGLGTRIFANGRYKAGYFDRGRYLGTDVGTLARASRESRRAAAARASAGSQSCEESCTEDAELRIGRINDEYECCFARHAFCSQKSQIALEACTQMRCRRDAKRGQDDCDLRYACDEVQTAKIARFRRARSECVEGCSSQDLDEHGLRVSERGTLLDD